MRQQQGFTLIETLVYLALFAIVIGGAVVAAYNMFIINGQGQTKAMVQEEGNFILAKINWTLAGAQTINSPAVGTPGSTLSINKWDTSFGNPLVIGLSATDVTLKKGTNAGAILNNSNVKVSALTFTHTGSGSNPEIVQATFTISTKTPAGATYTQNFSTSKYLRK